MYDTLFILCFLFLWYGKQLYFNIHIFIPIKQRIPYPFQKNAQYTVLQPSTSLYHKFSLINKLLCLFIYFKTFSTRTACILFASTFNTGFCIIPFHSISLSAFLTGITQQSLNTFYYVCLYSKADYSRFMNECNRRYCLASDSRFSEDQPLFLCIDDTTIMKLGTI